MFQIFGVKNRVAWHVQPVRPWAGRWLEFLHWGRQKHTGRTEHSGKFGGVRELEEQLTILVAWTSWLELRWHSLRRLGTD